MLPSTVATTGPCTPPPARVISAADAAGKPMMMLDVLDLYGEMSSVINRVRKDSLCACALPYHIYYMVPSF